MTVVYDFQNILLILDLFRPVLYKKGTTFQEGNRPDFRNLAFFFCKFRLVIDDRRSPRLEDYFERAMNIQDL